MTTKELINQYVTAHADNRWMDASELEALLTEFAEELMKDAIKTIIGGFRIGDKVRLKDGDGRPHTIKSFGIDGMKEYFIVVYFTDGTRAMLDNISLIS